jgi:threonine dehydratase
MIRVTPVVQVEALGHGVLFKLENLQRTGSFKFRGALARLQTLSGAERAAGVVAASAGNHGLGVALAGVELGLAVTVVVPSSTPEVKRHGIERLGATVIAADGGYDEADAVARQRAADTGAVFVSPFDDDEVIRGNGAELARELLAQAELVTRVVCPVGGGGLIGGLAQALQPRGVEVIGVQPQANCAMYDSLAAGRALTTYAGRPTLAEGCEGAVCERTFALARRHVGRIELVSEHAIREAIRFCYRRLGTIVEPSAAVAVAGMLEHRVTPDLDGQTAIVVTGGNIAPELLDEIVG